MLVKRTIALWIPDDAIFIRPCRLEHREETPFAEALHPDRNGLSLMRQATGGEFAHWDGIAESVNRAKLGRLLHHPRHEAKDQRDANVIEPIRQIVLTEAERFPRQSVDNPSVQGSDMADD